MALVMCLSNLESTFTKLMIFFNITSCMCLCIAKVEDIYNILFVSVLFYINFAFL